MKEQIILFATGWGAKHGGINSFNYDLCISLAKVLEGYYQIVCVVQDIDFEPPPVSNIPKNLSLVKSYEGEDTNRIIKNIRDETRGRSSLWVGHDVKTGNVANKCAKITGKKSVVVHHMNYLAYSTYQSGNAEKTQQKINLQKNILASADYILSVGPSLHSSAKFLLQKAEKSTENCFEIIPGLSEITTLFKPEIPQAVTYGRLDDDIVKQGKVAIGAFSKSAKDSSTPLYIIGVSDQKEYNDNYSKIYNDLQEFSSIYSKNRKVNIQPLPYKDRDEVFKELRVSSVSMMLSLHEGFGLAGWEAISAEVPLIISTNTGLYKFLEQNYPQLLNCIHPVIICGELEEDVNQVSAKLDIIFSDIEKHKKLARELKNAVNKYTWERTCKAFILSCNLDKTTPFTSDKKKLLELKNDLKVFIEDVKNVIAIKEDLISSLSFREKGLWFERDSLWKQAKIGEFVEEDKESNISNLTCVRRNFILKKRELRIGKVANHLKWLLETHKQDRYGTIPAIFNEFEKRRFNPLSSTFDDLISTFGNNNPQIISPWIVYYSFYLPIISFPIEEHKEHYEKLPKEIQQGLLKERDFINGHNQIIEWLKYKVFSSLPIYLQRYEEIFNYIDYRIETQDQYYQID